MLPVRHNQNWMPDIFNDFFDNTWMERPKATAPAINVLETPDAYQLELAAPGMTKADFDILLHQVPADHAPSRRYRSRSHQRQGRGRRTHREPAQGEEGGSGKSQETDHY